MRSHVVAKLFDRQDSFVSPVPGDQVLGLKLGPAARRKADAEVRQPVIPGTGNTQLFGATLRRMVRKRVKLFRCRLGPEQIRGKLRCTPGLNPTFHPYLAYAVILPVGEETNAVTAGKNFL